MSRIFKRIAIVGDDFGVSKLTKYIPSENISCIVGASIRPQYHHALREIALGLEVPFLIQPQYTTTAYPEFLEELKGFCIDMLLCCSYSMLIREDVLELVKFNAINLHSSLLPLNRGPNPVQWAIIKGEKFTGVTIHYMDAGIDSGDIIAQLKIDILNNDTWVSLNNKLNILANVLLDREIGRLLCGQNQRKKQNKKKATTNFRLTPTYPKIDFTVMSDADIYNLIRAQVEPLHGAYIEKNSEIIYFNHMLSIEEINKLRKENL